MRHLFLFITLLTLVGCDPETPHPNQQAVDRAEKLTDQAIAKAENAERELQHERRLRDLDKLNYGSEVTQTHSEVFIWRMLVACLSVLLVILIVWLSREIRLRRILAHVLRAREAAGEGVTP